MSKRALYIIDGKAAWARKTEVVRCWWEYDGTPPDVAHIEQSRKRFTGEECLQLDDGPPFFYLAQNLRVEHRNGRKIVSITTGGVSEEVEALLRASIAVEEATCS